MKKYRVIGENTTTGNTWTLDKMLDEDTAKETCRNANRLETDWKVQYRIEEMFPKP